MDTKKTAAGTAIIGILSMGAIDASVLKEVPLERIEMIAAERVEAKQIGNVIETTLPWKGEYGLKVKYDLGTPDVAERLADKRKQEVITEVVDFGEGGFKVDILLKERPLNNCFTYQLEGHENYDFFYQPALTQEEIEQGAERPEEIVGSYAVYHKTLRNHIIGQENYATGKFAHIPYPYVWELNNEESTKHRAESFTIENGNMQVCVSQEWLDAATYPVRIDPTFGYTSIGASTVNLGNPYGSSATSGSDAGAANLTTISIYGARATSNGDMLAALYSGNSRLVTQSAATAFTATVQWYDINMSAYALAASTGYNLMTWPSTTFVYRFDVGTDRERNQSFLTYPNWPNPASWATTGDRLHSIYATYTTGGGGGTTTPAQDVQWFD